MKMRERERCPLKRGETMRSFNMPNRVATVTGFEMPSTKNVTSTPPRQTRAPSTRNVTARSASRSTTCSCPFGPTIMCVAAT